MRFVLSPNIRCIRSLGDWWQRWWISSYYPRATTVAANDTKGCAHAYTISGKRQPQHHCGRYVYERVAFPSVYFSQLWFQKQNCYFSREPLICSFYGPFFVRFQTHVCLPTVVRKYNNNNTSLLTLQPLSSSTLSYQQSPESVRHLARSLRHTLTNGTRRRPYCILLPRARPNNGGRATGLNPLTQNYLNM